MTENQQQRTNDQHAGCLTLVVHIITQNRSNAYGQQREYGEHRFCTLTHIAHVAEYNQRHTGHYQQAVLHGRTFREVAGKSCNRHYQHDDVLDNGHRIGSPEGIRGHLRKHQIALQHIDRILLEGENGRIVQHAQQGYQPETTARKDTSQVADFKGIILLLGLTCLRIQLLVHKEVYDKHDQSYHQQYHAESDRTGNVDHSTQLGKNRRENHAGSHSQTGKRHLRPHGQCHFTALEPLDDTARHGNASHLDSTTENHKAHCRKLGRCRHPLIERRNAQFIKTRDVVQVVVKPGFQTASLKSLRNGIPVDGSTHQHHSSRKDSRETYTHLVQNDTGKDEEKDKYIQEGLGTLHGAEGGRIPSACGLHQVLDGRKNVHKDV